jgi:cell division initiation protein
MAITPVEIHHLQIGRRLFGYRRSTVDYYLDEIAGSYEVVWRERADLSDKVEQLEGELQRHRDLESLLRQTLVSAERASQDQVESARKEAERIVGEARAEARSIVRRAREEREQLEGAATRVASLLRSALGVVEERPGAGGGGSETEVRRLAG